MTTTPHKHAELIKAWADGETIQHFHMGRKEWVDCDPQWAIDSEYRVKPAKPAEPEKVYPVSMIDGEELNDFLDQRSYDNTRYEEDLQALANHILRQACDNGQIVTREDFDKCVLALQRIADIEDKANGGDWDEIEEARQIAIEALSGVEP